MTKPLTREQATALQRPLHGSRVARRTQGGQSLSYLEAWDVKAHLIRIFGFGGFSADVVSADLMFQIPPGEGGSDRNWQVGYKVVLRLRIPQLGCSYTEAAIGQSQQPHLGEAHDMAIKTAESDALKRAATYLGTQFGLSLYDNGRLSDVVAIEGIPHPLAPGSYYEPADEQQAAEQQVADTLGGRPVLSETGIQVVEDLRALSQAPADLRIVGVAQVKASVPPEVMEERTEVQGQVVTLARLADMVASGHFLRTTGNVTA